MRPGRSALIVALLAAPSCAQAPMDEYLVLARIIRIALTQVTWPGKNAEEPLRIAVIGGLNFGPRLDQILERNTVGGRTVVITYLSVNAFLEEKSTNDVLFIDRGWGAKNIWRPF